MLLIHACNILGYSAVFNMLQQKASDAVVAKLDKGSYNENELVEIKVPLSMPYSIERKEYERYDGQIEIFGVVHNYVKRKFFNDTLYLLCLPSHKENAIASAKSEYAKDVNDLTGSSQGKKSQPSSSNSKSGINEYNQYNAACNIKCPFNLLPNKAYPLFDLKPVLRTIPVQLQPPNFSKA